MLLCPNPGAFNSTLIMNRSIIIAKYLAGFWKLILSIEYENVFPDFKFHQMCNMIFEAVGSLVWVTQIRVEVCHAVEYSNDVCHAEEPGLSWCAITVDDGTCGEFDLLNATFGKFLILFVGLRFIAPYSIIKNNLVHTPHKIFLCIIIPDVDWYATLVEGVLKELGNFKA